MKTWKYVMSGGLAFEEEKDMKKLARLAKEGWILEKFAFLGYKLRRGEKQDIQYAIDYRKNPDDDYFAYFEEAGWNHVCSSGEYIHLFSASKGTTPIYSDKETSIEKYESEQKMMGKGAVIMLLLTLLFMVINRSSSVSYVSMSLNALTVISLTGLIFTGLPYLGYSYRVSKLRKKK